MDNTIKKVKELIYEINMELLISRRKASFTGDGREIELKDKKDKLELELAKLLDQYEKDKIKIAEIELKIENTKKNIVNIVKLGDDIIFNLSEKNFKIGETFIQNISFANIKKSSLRDKTPKIIRWLFAIIKEFNKGNNIIIENSGLYTDHFKEFDKVFPPRRQSKEISIGCNISNLKALLTLSKQNIIMRKGEKKLERILSI